MKNLTQKFQQLLACISKKEKITNKDLPLAIKNLQQKLRYFEYELHRAKLKNHFARMQIHDVTRLALA